VIAAQVGETSGEALWTWKPGLGVLNAVRERAAAEAVGIANWIGRSGCGLLGHAMVRHFEPERISLRCMSCGEQTAGWTLHARG
jgi:hypothetical protein